MRQMWEDRHEETPPALEIEGSQTFAGFVQTQLVGKRWGMFPNKKAVSRAQENTRRGNKPGQSPERHFASVEFERPFLDAVNMYEIKERVDVIVCTTMMCIYAHPHVAHIQIREKELRHPFNFMFGKEALGLYPWASAVFAQIFCLKF